MSGDERDHYAKAVDGVARAVETYNAARESLPVGVTRSTIDAVATASVGLLAASNAIDSTRATLALVDAVRGLDATLRELFTARPPLTVNIDAPSVSAEQIARALAERERRRGTGPLL